MLHVFAWVRNAHFCSVHAAKIPGQSWSSSHLISVLFYHHAALQARACWLSSCCWELTDCAPSMLDIWLHAAAHKVCVQLCCREEKNPFIYIYKKYNILQQKISFLFSPSPKTGLSSAQLHSDGVLGWLNGWAVLGPLHMSICILGHCSTLESKCQLRKVPSHAGYLNVSWFSPSAFLSLPKLSLYLFHVGTGTSQALAVLFLFPRWRLGSAEARILVLGYKTEQGKGSALPKMFCMGKTKKTLHLQFDRWM